LPKRKNRSRFVKSGTYGTNMIIMIPDMKGDASSWGTSWLHTKGMTGLVVLKIMGKGRSSTSEVAPRYDITGCRAGRCMSIKSLVDMWDTHEDVKSAKRTVRSLVRRRLAASMCLCIKGGWWRYSIPAATFAITLDILELGLSLMCLGVGTRYGEI